MPTINGTGLGLPEKPRDWKIYHVWKLEGSKPIKGFILRDYWIGIWTHFLRPRSVLCFGKDCDPSVHTAPSRWKAYVPFQGYASDTLVVVELTRPAVEVLHSALLRHGKLTGFLWEFKRAHPTNHSKILASYSKPPINTPPTHKPFPVMPSVLRRMEYGNDDAWRMGSELEQDAEDQFDRERGDADASA